MILQTSQRSVSWGGNGWCRGESTFLHILQHKPQTAQVPLPGLDDGWCVWGGVWRAFSHSAQRGGTSVCLWWKVCLILRPWGSGGPAYCFEPPRPPRHRAHTSVARGRGAPAPLARPLPPLCVWALGSLVNGLSRCLMLRSVPHASTTHRDGPHPVVHRGRACPGHHRQRLHGARCPPRACPRRAHGRCAHGYQRLRPHRSPGGSHCGEWTGGRQTNLADPPAWFVVAQRAHGIQLSGLPRGGGAGVRPVRGGERAHSVRILCCPSPPPRR
jgi:hypothetical protein